jgi:hypothetical protein
MLMTVDLYVIRVFRTFARPRLHHSRVESCCGTRVHTPGSSSTMIATKSIAGNGSFWTRRLGRASFIKGDQEHRSLWGHGEAVVHLPSAEDM